MCEKQEQTSITQLVTHRERTNNCESTFDIGALIFNLSKPRDIISEFLANENKTHLYSKRTLFKISNMFF